MIGGGKYDVVANKTRDILDADGVILLVVNGFMGNGFSVVTQDPELIRRLPNILRATADLMEATGAGAADADAIKKLVETMKGNG